MDSNKYFTPSIDDIRVGYEYEIRDWWTLEGHQGWSSNATEEEITKIKATWDKPRSAFTKRILTKDMLYEVPINKQGVDYRHEWERINTGIEDGSVRVSYLTKEQIEGEGFVKTKHKYAFLSFDKKDWIIWYDIKNYILHIEKGTRPLWTHTYYRGECKDINTFRYICKLLNIN